MNRLYLIIMEIVPLEVGKVYNELPSHLTLMSRFLSNLTPEELTAKIREVIAGTEPVSLVFGATIELGPKKVTVHMVDSPDEWALHERLLILLETAGVIFQYPEFIGANHKPHVTKRQGAHFAPGSQQLASAVYLVEVVDGKRVIRSKLALGAAKRPRN